MLPFLGIPGFANGGDVAAGTTAWVGERGPELVRFGSAAHVTPNHKLGNASTEPTQMHSISIDARGAHDPAQTEAAVHRAMAQYVPHIVAASISSGHDMRRRAPSTRP